MVPAGSFSARPHYTDNSLSDFFRLDSPRTKADVLGSQTVPKDGEDKVFKVIQHAGALSSAVEHFLHTEGVAGSNPAARTIFAIKIGGFIMCNGFLWHRHDKNHQNREFTSQNILT